MTNSKRRKAAIKGFEKYTKKPKEAEGMMKGVKITEGGKKKHK